MARLAVIKFLLSAALLFSVRVAVAQRNTCELNMHGQVQEMISITRDSSRKVLSEEKDEFDSKGRVLTRTIHDSNGAAIAIECSYESDRLVRAVTRTPDHSKIRMTQFRYSPDGLLLGAEEKNAEGVLIARTLSDPLRESAPALERTFTLHVSSPVEFNDRTVIDDENENASVTQLIVDGQEQASWRIERDSRGRVLRDEVAYSDLSFSQREFHQDGSSFEHSFTSDSAVHEYVWRDNHQRVVRSVTSSKSKNPSKNEVRYEYLGEDSGNWLTRIQIRDGNIFETTERRFEFRKEPLR